MNQGSDKSMRNKHISDKLIDLEKGRKKLLYMCLYIPMYVALFRLSLSFNRVFKKYLFINKYGYTLQNMQ